jgi:hypothetical protein
MHWQFWSVPWQRIEATASPAMAAAALATNDWSA